MSTGTFQPSDWESFMSNQAQFNTLPLPPPLPPLPADVSQFRHRESSQRSQQQQLDEQEPDFTVEDDVSEDVPPVPVSAPAVSSVQKANLKPKPAPAQAPVPLPQPTAYKTTKSGPPRPSSSSGANIVDLGHLHAKYEKELAQHQEEEEKKTQPAPAAAAAAAKPKPVPQSKTAPVAKPPVQKNSKEDDDDEEESETTKPKEAPKMKQQQQQQHTTTPEKKPQPVQQTVKPAAPAKLAPAKPVAAGPVPAAKKPVVSFAPKDEEEEEEEQEDAMDVSAPIAKPQQAPAKPENATEKMATTHSTKHRQEEVEAEREQPAAKRSKMSAPEEPVFVSEAQTKDMLKRILLGMVAALDGSAPVTDVLAGDKKKAVVVAAPAKPVAEKKPPVEFDGPAFGVYDYDEEMIESAIEIMREKVTKLTTAGTLEQVIETTGRKLTGFLPNKGYIIKENAKYSKPELSRYKALCEFIGRMVPDSLDSYKQLNRGISRLDIVMKYCKEHPPSDDRTRITAILMPEFEKTTEFMAHGIAHIIATIQLKFPQAVPAASEEEESPDQQDDE